MRQALQRRWETVTQRWECLDVYDITTTPLNQNFMRFVEMARLQTAQPFEVAMTQLQDYSKAGARVTLVIQDRKIAGMNISVPARYFAPAVAICADANIQVETVVCDTMTYIHPDHQRRGLSRSMRAASFTASASLGNVFMLGHANDTPEIAAWVRHVYKDCLSEQLDSQGDPIVWIKI